MRTFDVALRLDTEDFLTPQSDDALRRILDVLDAHAVLATFPVVGEKVRSWLRGGRADLIERLGRHAVGYHSDTHSLHPTIAEELAPLPWPEACAAFVAREREGYALVAETFGTPVCWTQPGGNWTAAALAVVRGWGVPMDFSEGWNSYLDAGPAPCRYEGLMHWSAPVTAPKPFLSGLPGNLLPALEMAERRVVDRTHGEAPLCIVAHPTELCTTAFWDAVNFGGGRMPPRAEWRSAPVRDAESVEAATAALDAYIGGLLHLGATFITAPDLVACYPDRAVGMDLPAAPLRALARVVGVGPGAVRGAGLALSAAEVFALICAALTRWPDGLPDGATGALPVRACDGPAESAPERAGPAVSGRAALVDAARWCDAHVANRAYLPSAVPLAGGSVPPADFLGAAARLLAHPEETETPLRRHPPHWERVVKPPERLHWDWPVFPPDFWPMGLWDMARLQAWTWKPAVPASEAVDWGAWAGASPWRPVTPGEES